MTEEKMIVLPEQGDNPISTDNRPTELDGAQPTEEEILAILATPIEGDEDG